MMRYLTLNEIKTQIVLNSEYTDEDEYLTHIGETAEEFVEQLVNQNLDETVAENGDLPKPLKQAMLIYCDYLYSTARGSSGTDHEVPNAVYTMIKLYRSFL